MYNKRGKHMGAFDPNTGEAMAGNCADATRTLSDSNIFFLVMR
ncbi:hypothetical protein KDW50_13550 [Burkholderia ambifaria]|jgi:hypothetical protein|nr:hypothetical protein [Burkholderia ambifaria]QDW49230.1 hypothetical protein FFI87_002135 [Burkholderia sp. KBS0801]